MGSPVIREATEDDLGYIVDLVERFHEQSLWKGLVPFDRESFRHTAGGLLARDDALILLSEGGIVALSKCPLYFNHGETITAELLFWAPDGQGDALRKAAEEWACGLVAIHAHGADGRVGNWLMRKGYAPIEAIYLKRTT